MRKMAQDIEQDGSRLAAGAADARYDGRGAKYAFIRDWLARRIQSGEFGRGQQLPSEHDVMDHFAVSRVTARQAFDQLRGMGLVEARRGKGYFVSALRATATLERLQSFGEMMAPLHLPTRSDVMELREISASAEVCTELSLPEGSLVLGMLRARKAAGTTVSLDESYLPLALGRQLMLLDLARQDVFVLMEKRLGIEIGYADITLDVRPVPPDFAATLGVGAGAQVIRLRRRTFTTAGTPIMFEHIYARIDLLQFRIRTPRW